jgi:hypothetical protein
MLLAIPISHSDGSQTEDNKALQKSFFQDCFVTFVRKGFPSGNVGRMAKRNK